MTQYIKADEEKKDKLRQGMVNFFNYLLYDGFVSSAVEDGKIAALFAERYIDLASAARFMHEKLGGVIRDYSELESLPGVTDEILGRLESLLGQMNLDNLSLLAPHTTRNNRVEAFVNGPDNLNVLLEEISRAERYIHCSFMLFFNDKSGELVTQALLKALSRGVVVRLMVDYTVTSLGYELNLEFGKFKLLGDKLEAAGARLQNTFDSSFPAEEWPDKRAELKKSGVPESYLYLQDFAQKQMVTGLNMINHRKFLVADGHTLILGSINVGDQYLANTPILTPGNVESEGRDLGIPGKSKEWHDGCFRIRGSAAFSVNRIFAAQWNLLGDDIIDPENEFYKPCSMEAFGEEDCTLFASFPGNPINLNQKYHLALLEHAGDEVFIVNPYLIDESFWEMLQSLDEERAGHIVICNCLKHNDHPTNLAAVRSHMYGPFEKGVSFYDYSATERFSHWKITYDRRGDTVFHGSYNLNERSSCHDYELGLLVKSPAFAEKVKAMIEYDLSVSKKITDAGEFFKHPALHPSTYWNKWTKNLT